MTAADRGPRTRPARAPDPLLLVTDRVGVGVTVAADAGMAVTELAVRGTWSPQLGERVSGAMDVCLAGPSASIIISLHGLEDHEGASLPFWLALWQRARFAATPVRVTFCLPSTMVLSRRIRRLQGPQPTVFGTVAEARSAIAERTSRADRPQAVRIPGRHP